MKDELENSIIAAKTNCLNNTSTVRDNLLKEVGSLRNLLENKQNDLKQEMNNNWAKFTNERQDTKTILAKVEAQQETLKTKMDTAAKI